MGKDNNKWRQWRCEGKSFKVTASGNYRVWIHSETRTLHDKNIQSSFKVFKVKPFFLKKLFPTCVLFFLACLLWGKNFQNFLCVRSVHI